MDLRLKDKIVCITGGSIGIGFGLAEGFAREGAHLALCARNQERVEEVARNLMQQFAIEAIGIPADVTNPEDIGRFIQAVEKSYGKADILINNAGTGSSEKIMDAPDDRWQYYWDLHVMAAVRMSRGLVPLMRQMGGGAIVNIASVCALQPLDYEPIYNTTKAALVMFSKCLANELIGEGIRVNTVSPGLILTPDWKKTATILSREMGITWEQYLDNIAREKAPIARFSSPEELAHFIVFLCSPLAGYCVGSTYYVDGGMIGVTV